MISRLSLSMVGYILALLLASCSAKPYEIKYRGQAMGTTWSVKVSSKHKYDSAVAAAIQEELDLVDQLMSNWKDDSDVTRFNQSEINSCTEVNKDTLAVFLFSQRIAGLSEGAFNVTLGPLIEAWGFGKNYRSGDIPSDEVISQALIIANQQQIYATDNELCKRDLPTEINLSGIAKGYAVDRVAIKLESLGFSNYLVEVGGELRGQGVNGRGSYWSVGVEQPTTNLATSSYRTAIALVDQAIATSGDYRNFFEVDNVKYSHILDPSTGYPVTHNLASVTVLAPSSMEADAWATALLVLGPEKGIEIANAESLAVMMILRDQETFQVIASNHWPET